MRQAVLTITLILGVTLALFVVQASGEDGGKIADLGAKLTSVFEHVAIDDAHPHHDQTEHGACHSQVGHCTTTAPAIAAESDSFSKFAQDLPADMKNDSLRVGIGQLPLLPPPEFS